MPSSPATHRSKLGKARLQEVIALSRQILGIPAGYRLGIVPGSDTGAVEMALWSNARLAARRGRQRGRQRSLCG